MVLSFMVEPTANRRLMTEVLIYERESSIHVHI
jgi:hypothetical protein